MTPMTVSEFKKVARLSNWEVYGASMKTFRAPFCKGQVVWKTVVSPPAKTGPYRRYYEVVEPIVGREYKKRFLTEMRKENERVFVLLKDAEQLLEISHVLDYCT